MRDRVAAWKSQFLGSSGASYESAKPNTFRLVPPAERLTPLRQDHQAMRDMDLSEPATFDEVLTTLTELEARINGAGSA